MKEVDEVTLLEDIAPYCPDCGRSDNIKVEGEPFKPGHNLVVIPIVCLDCGYSFSLHVRLRVVRED